MADQNKISQTDIEVIQIQEWRKHLMETLGRMEKKIDTCALDVCEVKAQLRLGDQRMDQIDKHLEATDDAVEELKDEDTDIRKEIGTVRKDPVALWTSIAAAIATVGGIIYTAMGGTPPSPH